jgi:hypothetical protein
MREPVDLMGKVLRPLGLVQTPAILGRPGAPASGADKIGLGVRPAQTRAADRWFASIHEPAPWDWCCG